MNYAILEIFKNMHKLCCVTYINKLVIKYLEL